MWENSENLQKKPNKIKKWVIWIISILWILLILAIISNYLKSWELYHSNSSDNAKLNENNLYSWILQSEDEEADTEDEKQDTQELNAKILEQLKDESYWEKKIQEAIDDSFDSKYTLNKKWNIEILWYWLLCSPSVEYLWSCRYHIWFLNDQGFRPDGRKKIDWYSQTKGDFEDYYRWSYWSIWYETVAKELAMADIWNWGVFYDVSDWHYDDELIQKYLWEDFESNYTWDYGFIEVVHFITNNDDWTSDYHLYIVPNETWEFLYKTSKKIISRESAKKIIANDAWIGINNVKYLSFKLDDFTYTSKFSYKWHTYDYVIDATDGNIKKGWNKVDIWRDKAMEIAIKDSWIKSKDLWKDISHWHWHEETLLMPSVYMRWSGQDAIYSVEIETNKEKVYSYEIKATDGKILSKHFSENFVISSKKWEKDKLIYKIESAFPKKKKLEINLSELNMDDIYEFKDFIYLWVTLSWDNVIDWSIIDKPYENLWKRTRDDLDKRFNFESRYSIKEVDKKIDWEKEDEYTIKLSNLDEKIIYKFTIKKGENCGLEIINDLWKDVIVYQNKDSAFYHKGETYSSEPYLKDGYAWRSQGCYGSQWDEYFFVMYEEATSEDLFKIIAEKEITYLSKFEIWEELERWYDEIYLYNDTESDLTILVTDWRGDDKENLEFTLNPWKFAHCSRYADSVKIIE